MTPFAASPEQSGSTGGRGRRWRTRIRRGRLGLPHFSARLPARRSSVFSDAAPPSIVSLSSSSASESWAIALALVAATFVAFWPVSENGFVGFDDPRYITRNDQVRAGLTARSVAWAFTTTHANNWHPLTWLSHMTDVELFGLDPAGHHRVSVALHAANGVLLFVLLRCSTGALWPSALVAFLFALHPLRVESVAWASERKDVLGASFWFLTMLLLAEDPDDPNLHLVLALISAERGDVGLWPAISIAPTRSERRTPRCARSCSRCSTTCRRRSRTSVCGRKRPSAASRRVTVARGSGPAAVRGRRVRAATRRLPLAPASLIAQRARSATLGRTGTTRRRR